MRTYMPGRSEEFVSGEPPSLPLRGELRTWEALLARLVAGVKDRQRTDRLVLPIDFATAGVYKIEGFDVAKKVFVIEERFTGEKVEVKFEEVHPSLTDPASVVLDKNHSEAFVELVLPGLANSAQKACRIGNRFRSHVVGKKRDMAADVATPAKLSPAKRRRTDQGE
eukprot:963758-Amphidinium_carterae.1